MPTPSKKSSSVLPTGGGQALPDIYGLIAPNYAAVMESYQKAQDVLRQAK